MNTRASSGDKLFLTGMVITMTFWGLSWASGKVLSRYGDALTISFYRFALTFISLPLIVWFLKVKVVISKKWIFHVAMAALMMSLYTFLFFKGLEEGKAGAGGVLVTTLNPVVAYAMMLVLTWRKPTMKETIGLVVGMVAGAILLKLMTDPGQLFHAGNIYFLLAAFSWAVLSNFTARASRYGSAVAFSFWLYAISTVVMFLLAGFQSSIDVFHGADFTFWSNLFFVSAIVAGGATTFYFVATSKIGASRASSFIFMVPFSAALGSWIFLGERIEAHTIIGGILGIIAVYILNRK